MIDDENRLAAVWLPGSGGSPDPQQSPISTGGWASTFVYDGLSRLRLRKDFYSYSGGWYLTNTVEYIYDGNRVIQERNAISNAPTVSYTRGPDLSGSLEGAGGIGGLLARTDNTLLPSTNAHAFYFNDGNGNITYMLDSSQTMVATYRYDPFGNTISAGGVLSNANVYRFSSKEIHLNSGMYYFGYRFYDPYLQRWINRDPIGELGGVNLYEYVNNKPNCSVDPFGLSTDELLDCFCQAQQRFAKNQMNHLKKATVKHMVWTTFSALVTAVGLGAAALTEGAIVLTPTGLVGEIAVAVNDMALGSVLTFEAGKMTKEAQANFKKDISDCVKNSPDPQAQQKADQTLRRYGIR